MAQRTDITNAMLTACQAIASNVNWGFSLTGAKKSNLVEGTITCDEVTFLDIAKDKQHAKAEYNIVIVELDGNVDIDDIADNLFKCFNGTDMGGLCYSVNINRIAYGAVQGMASSKVVKMELNVEYPID